MHTKLCSSHLESEHIFAYLPKCCFISMPLICNLFLCRCAFFNFAFHTSCKICTTVGELIGKQRQACGEQRRWHPYHRHPVSVQCNACGRCLGLAGFTQVPVLPLNILLPFHTMLAAFSTAHACLQLSD